MPHNSADSLQHDVLIIGSGAAGLLLALHLAPHARVAVLSKRSLHEGNTYYAQGGIAAVLDENDSVEAHVADTLDAGSGLGHPDVIRHVAEQAPAAIAELVERGVAFTRDGHDGRLHLTREGGHSHRRIVHAADATGQAVELTLAQQVRLHPNIDLYEDHIAIDLITARKPTHRGGQQDTPNAVQGAYVLDARNDQVRTFSARAVALATGGASKVYLYTSNPDLATGDGIAMAWRAGCRVANLEFNQFHPTCLYHPQAKSFLITEAVRGEGGRLLLPDGTPFMQHFDRRGELAPRDIVARAIDHEMKRLGADHLLLDISFRGPEFVREHFPTVYARVLEFGYDLSHEPIPIVPAAHYTCGGVLLIYMDVRMYHNFMPLAKPRTRVCMALTAWPAIPCWNAWCLPAMQRKTSCNHSRSGNNHMSSRFGTKAASPIRMKKLWFRTTGMNCAASCGTTLASCARPNALSAHSVVSRYCSKRSQNTMVTSA